MRITTNYRAIISRFYKAPIVQSPISNNNIFLQPRQTQIQQPSNIIYNTFKKIYHSSLDFILNRPKKYEDIPPLPKLIFEQPHRKRHKVTLLEVSEDRKVLEKNIKEWYVPPRNKKEEEKLNILLTQKNGAGEYIFTSSYSIHKLVKKKDLSPSTLKDAFDFCIKNPKGVSCGAFDDINDANIDVFKTLLSEKYSNDKYRYFDVWGDSILNATNTGNKDATIKLLKAKDTNGQPRFDNSSILYIMQNINQSNSEAVPYLLDARKSNGALKLRKSYEWSVLSVINRGNINAVPYLLNHTTKIKSKIKHTLDISEFSTIIAKINPENIETVPYLMDVLSKTKHKRRGFLTTDKVARILQGVKNGQENVIPEILKLKNPTNKSEYLFNSEYECQFVGEVAKAYSDKSLKPIAKKLLKKRAFTIISNKQRFDSAEGIYEYAQMVRDKKYLKERFYLAKFFTQDFIPRFRNMKEIVELSKALADPERTNIVKQLITLKDPYTKKHLLSGFHRDNTLTTLNKDLDFKAIKQFLQVTNASKSESVLDLKTILEFVTKFKKYKIAQIPIPKILPKGTIDSESIKRNIGLIDQYRKGTLKIDELSSIQKLEFKSYLSALIHDPLSEKPRYKFNIHSLQKEINKYITQTIIPTPVETIHKTNLFKYVLNNNPTVENQIKNFDFAQYGRRGLPLEYSRTMFLNELKEILNTTSDTVKKHILHKLQIQPDSNFQGYEGIIYLDDLNRGNKLERKVYEAGKHFILQNKVVSGNAQFDQSMNALIKGMPEFINIIGKQPHGSHNYSIDIHILEVLRNCINHPDYQKLDNLTKTRLKMAVLMHDIAKKEGVVDKQHQDISALYARNILSKYNMPQSLKDDVYFLIQNHHWLEELNNNLKSVETLACNFRNPQDFIASKIFTFADLKSVSPEIFDSFNKDLEGSKQKELYKFIEKLKESGNILFTSKIIDKRKIPTEQYKNCTYKVVNLPDISSRKDLGEIGFFPGTKKEDLRFLVHTVRDAESLHRVEDLSDVSQNIVLSLSYISPTKNSAYWNNKYGVIVETNIPDIINASPVNQGSGCTKDKSRLVDLKTHKVYKDYKEFLPKMMKKLLGINSDEYKTLYEQISSKKHLTQIQDEDILQISSNRFLNGKEIREAIVESEDKLLKGNLSEHNEIVGSYLKVVGLSAKANDIKQVPPEYLDFVQQYDIPIYLLGK